MAQVAKRDVCIPQDGRAVEAVCMECTNFGEDYMKTFSRSYKTFSANSKTSSANCETFSAGWRQQRKTRPRLQGGRHRGGQAACAGARARACVGACSRACVERALERAPESAPERAPGTSRACPLPWPRKLLTTWV